MHNIFRIIYIHQTGLLDFWKKQEHGNPRRCLDKTTTKSDELNEYRAMSLKKLTGAFLCLAIGYAISIAAFIIEQRTSCEEQNCMI